MTPEEKHLLERSLRLAEDNNEMLRRLTRYARAGRIWKALYWIVIIGASFGAYYFVQPYVDAAKTTYSGFQDDVSSFQKVKDKLFGN
jgi:hypothetical protein